MTIPDSTHFAQSLIDDLAVYNRRLETLEELVELAEFRLAMYGHSSPILKLHLEYAVIHARAAVVEASKL